MGSKHTVAGDALVVWVRGCPSPSIMPPCTRYVPPWWETSWPWRLPSCWLVLICNRHITSGHSVWQVSACTRHQYTMVKLVDRCHLTSYNEARGNNRQTHCEGPYRKLTLLNFFFHASVHKVLVSPCWIPCLILSLMFSLSKWTVTELLEFDVHVWMV